MKKVTLSTEETSALLKWAFASTTGYGPAFDGAIDAARRLYKRLDGANWLHAEKAELRAVRAVKEGDKSVLMSKLVKGDLVIDPTRITESYVRLTARGKGRYLVFQRWNGDEFSYFYRPAEKAWCKGKR